MAWTDERIDDFVQEMREFRRETREDFRSLRGELAGLRSDLLAMQRQMTQIGFGLAALMLAQIVVSALT